MHLAAERYLGHELFWWLRRGVVPTMGEYRQLYHLLKNVVRSPLVGQTLYKLNTTPSFRA